MKCKSCKNRSDIGECYTLTSALQHLNSDIARMRSFSTPDDFWCTLYQGSNTGCFIDYDPKYPLDYYRYCLKDIGQYCDKSVNKETCKYWRASSEKE